MGLLLRPQTLAVLTCASVWFGAVLVANSVASFPGTNGLIAVVHQGPQGGWTIWGVDPRSGNKRQLTRTPQRCTSDDRSWTDEQPSFSASGRLIAYHHTDSCDPLTRDGIYVMRSDGTGRRLIARESQPDSLDPGWPTFAPRDRSLALANEHHGDNAVVTAPFPRHGLIQRGDTRPAVRGFPRYDWIMDPAWGANGRLAFLLGSRGGEPWGHIATVAANGTGLRLVTRSARDGSPDWSPSSRRIVFRRESIASSRSETSEFHGDVFVAHARGHAKRRPRRLTFRHDAFTPVWSPDGRYIAYIRARGDFSPDGSLWIMRAADGGGQRMITAGVIGVRASWQPRQRG
jgi:Tol biopolymer transport system component